MARSKKKGPFVAPDVLTKLGKLKRGEITEIVTWSRSSMITPEMVGVTIRVHNGRTHVPVRVTEAMIGHRLGEFAPTRVFRGHGGVKKKVAVPK
ncbi:MAG: SSU ribosomal protein S19p (S15e) [Candidatus Bipolaricaulis sibiricus]|uniref:Small ribosomal subunit protein uS19 n=1 Tax=Bipolaricaulis sibiricus TaxID=2501609 RepID=A0A410FU00_BIPS1|nr:MAG: SSU ribosomal protein S19p (S15e) [Candidatus Bipolaricaulis sibiricus]